MSARSRFAPAHRFFGTLGVGMLAVSLLFAGGTALAAGPRDAGSQRPDFHRAGPGRHGGARHDHPGARPHAGSFRRPESHGFRPGTGPHRWPDHHEARPHVVINRRPDFDHARPDAFGEGFHHHRAWPHYGSRIGRLPLHHVPMRVGRNRYFFHAGIFYRPAPFGYIAVRPPIGAVVAEIPVNRTIILSNGVTYYYVGGAYYRRVPSGYIVVTAPSSEPPPIEISGGSQVTVSARLLNVRSGPGGQYEVIGQVSEGETLTVRGDSPGWLLVDLPDGTSGWVQEAYVLPAGDQVQRLMF